MLISWFLLNLPLNVMPSKEKDMSGLRQETLPWPLPSKTAGVFSALDHLYLVMWFQFGIQFEGKQQYLCRCVKAYGQDLDEWILNLEIKYQHSRPSCLLQGSIHLTGHWGGCQIKHNPDVPLPPPLPLSHNLPLFSLSLGNFFFLSI